MYIVKVQALQNRPFSWQELCEDGRLADLPYRIETDARGRIVMSPTRRQHGIWQFQIAEVLKSTLGGVIVVECAIRTTDGIKVADVAWYSKERDKEITGQFEAEIAGEICVEIMSPSNTAEEMKEKMSLFFEKGAQEVWVCDLEGKMRFFTSGGEISKSKLVPSLKVQL